MDKISKPPWRVESYLEPFDSVIKTWQVVSAEDLIVAKCGKGDFEIEANARFIATAPDMMEILEKMAEALGCMKEMVEMGGLGKAYAMEIATQALQEYRKISEILSPKE